MESTSIGTAILSRAPSQGPLSVAEWEARYGGLGYVQDEGWFKAAGALMRWSRKVAGAAVRQPAGGGGGARSPRHLLSPAR